MALYFPEEFIQEVIDKNDIVSTISSYVKLKQSGSTLKGLCPFHKEKTPSFSVSPDKQLFYCFGCGKGGTVINFVMYLNNLDFVEAVTMLAEKVGLEIPQDGNKSSNNAEIKQTIYKINALAGRFFYDNLMTDGDNAAKAYAIKRGLSQNTINRFGLGYAPSGNMLIDYLRGKDYTDEQILSSGVAGKSENGDLYDRFRNRLIFPIIDVRKNIIGFGGRVLDDSLPKYLNSPETATFSKSHNLFGLNFAKSSKEDYLILVEGYMDVISLHQSGITSAVATLGTALTPEQARIIKRTKNEVIISYDSDEAGQKATKRAIEMLVDEGLSVRVLIMGKFKDPDEYIKANGAGAFKQLINDAPVQIEYKISKLKEQYYLEDSNQKLQYINAIATEFVGIKSPVEREIYVKKISDETGVSVNSIFSEIGRLETIANRKRSFDEFHGRPSERILKKEPPEKAKVAEAQKIILNLFCYNKEIYDTVSGLLERDDFDDGALRMLYDRITGERKTGSEPDARIIISGMPDNPIAVEILHDDKNIEDPILAANQAVTIIQNYRKKKKMLDALKAVDATEEQRIERINELFGGNTKEGGSK